MMFFFSCERYLLILYLLKSELFICCSLGVCFKPYTPRCGHPFCQQCIIKVMMKCSVQCPVCNGILTRRTLIQNNHLSSIIIFLYKIEHAIKTDINLESKFLNIFISYVVIIIFISMKRMFCLKFILQKNRYWWSTNFFLLILKNVSSNEYSINHSFIVSQPQNSKRLVNFTRKELH